jgi:Ca2+-binding RTX toxin-like protein
MTTDVTGDNTLIVQGTGTVGHTIEVFANGTSLGTAIVDAMGDWSVDGTGTTAPEGNSITIAVTDTEGNRSGLADSVSDLAIDALAPTADIVDIAPDPRMTGVDTITIQFSENVSGVDVSDFTLTRDGTEIDLTMGGGIDPAPALISFGIIDPPKEYTLLLASIDTSVVGTYVLTLNAAGSGIQDAGGTALTMDASDTWIVGEDEVINDITGTPARDQLTGTSGKDRITGGFGADTLTGGVDSDQFVYESIRDAGDTITDFEIGSDQIVLTEVLDSFGYNGADAITDGYVQVMDMGSDSVVRLDPDGPNGRGIFRPYILVEGVAATDLNAASNFAF